MAKFLLTFFLIFSLSCSAAKEHHYRDNNYPSSSRKVIYTAYISLLVKNSDSVNNKIKSEILPKYKGYVNKMGTYQTIIRVEKEYLNSAVSDISKLGKVQNKNISGQDVTDEFLDNQIRVDNALKSRNRYLELLSKAETVEDALKIEKELERLNNVIDILKGKMNRVDHLSKYATITINFSSFRKKGESQFINMPGIEYNLLLVENPTVDKSKDKYQGIALKYLFTSGKSYFNLGIMKSIGKTSKEVTEIFTYAYGADFYPSYLSEGRFFNLYSGFLVGGAYLTSKDDSSSTVYFNAHIGLELIKTSYILLDIKAGYFLPVIGNREFRGLNLSSSFNFVF